jgi:hypothetical protein
MDRENFTFTFIPVESAGGQGSGEDIQDKTKERIKPA